MTETPVSPERERRRCRWCGRPFSVGAGPGRPREFCRQACRQREYEARRGGRRSVDEGDVLVLPRAAVRDLQDRLWLIEAAVDDARLAVAEAASARACRSVLDGLVAALTDTVPLWREPGRDGSESG